MTPDEERRLLKMLESYEWKEKLKLKITIWAKSLASVAAGVAGLRYLWGLKDLLK